MEGALAASTVHAPAAAGNPFGYAVGNTQHVVYRAVDNRIHELWCSPGIGWREGGLAARTGQASAAAGDPAGYGVGHAQPVFCRAVDGRIHGLVVGPLAWHGAKAVWGSLPRTPPPSLGTRTACSYGL